MVMKKMNSTDLTSRVVNLIILGSDGIGKSTLGIRFAKTISEEKGEESVKIAKIYAEDFNKKDIPSTVAKIAGGTLIIEEAGDLDDAVVEQLSKAMEFRTDALLVVLEDEKKYLKELFEKHHVGDSVEGVVKNVTDFGAFIDLGGADGLLHISEMSWGRVNDPSSVVKVGDVVKTFIKDINGEKIALSMKFEDENPWVKAADKYAIGNVVTGKVVRFASFGAFVELEPGVDGLLHVSQISKERVEKPEDVLKVGQEITAKVVDFKAAEKKISLSIRALDDAQEASEEE